ncbi:MAG: hypothetical protein QOD14_281 [Solirubrobacterales bacterium]|jgi:hypothetical protein|nr:hypothetical protein [Solirubrobacterales bacterium]
MKLMGQDAQVFARLHRPIRRRVLWSPKMLTAVAVFAAALVAVISTGHAGAAPRVVVLGAATPAVPSCPTNCQAVGKTTGFQTSIAGAANPFIVPFRGRVVAWSIKTGAPSTKPNPSNNNQSDYDFFSKTFGGAPKARVSVLKPIMKSIRAGKPIYKLKSQSPVEDLSPYLGQTTTFTLDTPLRVKPTNVVALTVPTWAPAFAINQSANTKWAASRKKGKCNDTADILAGTPQDALGTQRSYGCVYNTARLLYSATVVADPNQAPPKKKK